MPWFTTKLVSSCKTLLCCHVRPHWNCSLWANTHRCRAHQWEYAYVSSNDAPTRYIWTQIAIRQLFFFFLMESSLASCEPCTAEPGLGNWSSALKCWLGLQFRSWKPGCLATLPHSLVPHSSSWWRCSTINVRSSTLPSVMVRICLFSHKPVCLSNSITLPKPDERAESTGRAAETLRARGCLCTYRGSVLRVTQ